MKRKAAASGQMQGLKRSGIVNALQAVDQGSSHQCHPACVRPDGGIRVDAAHRHVKMHLNHIPLRPDS